MGVAETVDHVAFPVVDADSVAYAGDAALDWGWTLLADVDGGVEPFANDIDGACFVSGPLANKFAIGGEDLDAVTLAVADDYEIVIEDGDVVRKVELSVVRTGLSP